MASVQEAIEVGVPVHTAYDQWTQLETFPQFMEGIVSVEQIDDTHVRWVAEASGARHEWEAEIVRQEPDRAIAWRTVDGTPTRGEVSFEPIGSDATRVVVELEYKPQGVKESIGSALGMDARYVRQDLERFKEMIEARGSATGAWRGEVRGGADGV